MDFSQIDIRRFLTDSIPSRFRYLKSSDFISFMAFVFQTDGYEVKELREKDEFGTLLLAEKDDMKLLIRPLQYTPDHHVSVNEVLQAEKARGLYRTHQSWIITTSDFSEVAKEKAEELDIELWDWDTFYNALMQLFFEGKSHLDILESGTPSANASEEVPDLRLKVKWQPVEGVSPEWYNLELIIQNPTDRNIYLHLDLPVLIDAKKSQASAEQWASQEFVAGYIYSGASVKTNALFSTAKLGESPPGGKIILTCHENTDRRATYHLSAKLKGSACYIVTYCYTRNSHEYEFMISYRDNRLAVSPWGRVFIKTYYLISPSLIQWAKKYKWFDFTIKLATRNLVGYLMKKHI